ncbi:MAG: sulfotransferase family 2 domain-containing protein [Gammaproteobacteria bacterium]
MNPLGVGQHLSAGKPNAPSFDNRGASLRVKLGALFRGRGSWRGGRHFQFEVNGRSVVYCYIRKNACSAFVKLICEESPHRSRLADYADPHEFLSRHHRTRSTGEIEAADHRLFVYRNPIERMVSLFKNKFIARVNNADILASYARLAKQDPDQASFRDFVLRYLGEDQAKLDPHCLSQYRHLLPVNYTDAIRMDSLRIGLVPVIGHNLSEKYFRSKLNSSLAIEDAESAHDVPSSVLHRKYKEAGLMPSVAAILDQEIEDRLSEIYADDQRMIETLSNASARSRSASASDPSLNSPSNRDPQAWSEQSNPRATAHSRRPR